MNRGSSGLIPSTPSHQKVSFSPSKLPQPSSTSMNTASPSDGTRIAKTPQPGNPAASARRNRPNRPILA